MRLRTWPAVGKFSTWRFTVEAHSRGATGVSGHYSYERGPGARVTGQLNIVPMCSADAVAFRAFLHSLRGPSGSFFLRLPDTAAHEPGDDCGYPGGLTIYDDCTDHTDSTGFTDVFSSSAPAYSVASTATLGAAASADAATVTLAAPSYTPRLIAGNWLAIGDLTTTGQLVQIVSVSGLDVTIRPRLRNAQAFGAAVTYGPVTGLFRLVGKTPKVPLIPGRSSGLSVEIEEAY